MSFYLFTFSKLAIDLHNIVRNSKEKERRN